MRSPPDATATSLAKSSAAPARGPDTGRRPLTPVPLSRRERVPGGRVRGFGSDKEPAPSSVLEFEVKHVTLPLDDLGLQVRGGRREVAFGDERVAAPLHVLLHHSALLPGRDRLVGAD